MKNSLDPFPNSNHVFNTLMIQETIIRIGRKKEVTDRDFYMSLLFKAYSGLVWYVEWKKCKSIVDHVRNTAQDDTGILSYREVHVRYMYFEGLTWFV